MTHTIYRGGVTTFQQDLSLIDCNYEKMPKALEYMKCPDFS